MQIISSQHFPDLPEIPNMNYAVDELADIFSQLSWASIKVKAEGVHIDKNDCIPNLQCYQEVMEWKKDIDESDKEKLRKTKVFVSFIRLINFRFMMSMQSTMVMR